MNNAYFLHFNHNLHFFIYRLVSNKLTFIIINMIISVSLYILIKQQLNVVYAMDQSANQPPQEPPRNPYTEFARDPNRLNAEALRAEIARRMNEGTFTEEQMQRFSVYLNTVVRNNNPNPTFEFNANNQLQDLGNGHQGDLPADHPDAAENVQNLRRAVFATIGIGILALVTCYLIYRNWDDIRNFILDLVGFFSRQHVLYISSITLKNIIIYKMSCICQYKK